MADIIDMADQAINPERIDCKEVNSSAGMSQEECFTMVGIIKMKDGFHRLFSNGAGKSLAGELV